MSRGRGRERALHSARVRLRVVESEIRRTSDKERMVELRAELDTLMAQIRSLLPPDRKPSRGGGGGSNRRRADAQPPAYSSGTGRRAPEPRMSDEVDLARELSRAKRESARNKAMIEADETFAAKRRSGREPSPSKNKDGYYS